MSRKGDCWDNAVAESFFSTIKRELVRKRYWMTMKAARLAIHEYIEAFYNGRRRHSTNGNLSPVEYERRFGIHAAMAA
jgi:putative transposase